MVQVNFPQLYLKVNLFRPTGLLYIVVCFLFYYLFSDHLCSYFPKQSAIFLGGQVPMVRSLHFLLGYTLLTAPFCCEFCCAALKVSSGGTPGHRLCVVCPPELNLPFSSS